MELFRNVYTYLIISFGAMCILLFKFAYVKVQDGLKINIESIRESIEKLEKRRDKANAKYTEVQRELISAKQNVEKVIQEAEAEARRIVDQSADIIRRAIDQKRNEYDKEVEQVKSGLYSELHHKISDMVMKEIVKEVKEMQSDRNFQNAGIDAAIDKLEKLVMDHNTSNKKTCGQDEKIIKASKE
ncbi:MAG: ATP synthase F0 subunit B [Holosporales bacterium]|jgi:F-type H+-transporting ATPase subunit delta|nr:ATP synthase F0 subunit B [Holosporales bacterium]